MSTTPIVISGRNISKKIKAECKDTIKGLQEQYATDEMPGLAVILVGHRPDSAVYVRMKKRAAKTIGIRNIDISLPEDVTQKTLLDKIDTLNQDDTVHGILVQLPLPSHLDEDAVLSRIQLEKDVDGFHSKNMGLLAMKGREPLAQPCTPMGCIELLKRYAIPIEGKKAVVLGRSNIVGVPVALMLIKENATVTICHSRTIAIEKEVAQADIVIAAIGKPQFVKASWLKKGAVVLDVGINEVKEGDNTKLVGDSDYDAIIEKGEAHAITPVPGGVGPMTIAMLMQNTTNSFQRYLFIKHKH